MKRIEFIAPVESMRGNLSGSQELNYRENNNPAYEAPNGDAHALNYQPRFIGAKRSKDGLKYFAVRTKSTTKLNAATRTTMALLGVIAAMKSALKTRHAADWSKLQQAYAYQVEHGIAVPDTFDKWVNDIFRTMLKYKQESYTFNQASISVSVYNPYGGEATALVISRKVWEKFADVLNAGAFDGHFTIDSVKFPVIMGNNWEELKDATSTANPNVRACYAGITIPMAGSNPLYNGRPIYDLSGVVQTGESVIDSESAEFTTINPNA